MVSLPSGLLKNEPLIKIKTEDLYLVISGDVDLNRYEQENYKSFIEENESMFFSTSRDAYVEIFDVTQRKLVENYKQPFLPVFFENGRYEIQVKPLKKDLKIQFYHEYESFRKAIRPILNTNILSGTLHFLNEVGFSNFEIHDNQGNSLLSVVIEVYPAKLDYKKDYRALLDEVSEEVYNLAYDFLKRTFLTGATKQVNTEPTGAEFYRLIRKHFESYIKAVDFVEQKPHMQLNTVYEIARGDRLRKQDATGRTYLRKHADLFIEVGKGIALNGKQMMPQKGLLIKKNHTFDTHENRYVKWTLERLYQRIDQLHITIQKAKEKYHLEPDQEVLNILNSLRKKLSNKLKKPFWRRIGQLDRSVMSVVLQMATGYREIYQIYSTLSKGIVLSGEIYKMSVKDIAILYEYWTFLRLGKILREKCEVVSHDIIKVTNNGLVVNLEKGSKAKWVFKNKKTGEFIKLQYQYSTGKNATVTQIPDTMLIIEKLGRDYDYLYIFDAKYRINFGSEEGINGPGPMEDDINTMHRYRDAIVAESEGRYEREAFGAYVLFPWNDQVRYKEHHLYKSIEKVNIGGLPFLPKSTDLVETIIDNLLNKTAEELQAEGILPIGTKEFLYRNDSDYVLIVPALNSNDLMVRIRENELPKHWHKAKKIALSTSKGIHHESFIKNITREGKYIVFQVEGWPSPLNDIQSGGYSLIEPLLVEEHLYNGAYLLPELLMENNVQRQFLKMLKEIVGHVEIELGTKVITQNTKISSFRSGEHIFHWKSNSLFHERDGEIIREIPKKDLEDNLFEIFKELVAEI